MTPVLEIQNAVADAFGIPPEEMTSQTRKWRVAHPRQIAMMIARQHTGYSLPRLGRLFGHRDHTTILYGIESAHKRIAKDRNLAATVHWLEQRFQAPSTTWSPPPSRDPCQRCGARPGMCGHSHQRLVTVACG